MKVLGTVIAIVVMGYCVYNPMVVAQLILPMQIVIE